MIARACALVLMLAGGWVVVAWAWAWMLRMVLRLVGRYYR